MDDLIGRQAAIDAVNNAFDRETLLTGFVRSIAVRAIRDMPSVQPEVRTGKWTLGFDNKYMEKYYYCSCCGGRKYGEHEPLDYFCSNCGADMRGEQDG